MRKISKFLFASLILLTANCGGGGGGGRSSADSTGARFIHAALEASPRQIVIDGIATGSFVGFGGNGGFKKLSGLKSLNLIGRAGDLDAVPVTDYSKDVRVDIVLFQSPTGTRALSFTHPLTTQARGVRLINAARSIDGGVASSTLGSTSVPYGSASEYQSVSDSISVDISGALRNISLPVDGTLFTLVAVGEAGYLTSVIVLKDQ